MTFYQYEIVKLRSHGMQSRMHRCEQMFCFLASSNGMKFFTKLCEDAYDKIYAESYDQVISARQISRMNLILAMKKGVEAETKNFR